MTTPSGRISNEPGEKKRKREEKKMPFIVATYVYASSQGQRMHSARTKIWFIYLSAKFFYTFILVAVRISNIVR